jgi:hypothetical protein
LIAVEFDQLRYVLTLTSISKNTDLNSLYSVGLDATAVAFAEDIDRDSMVVIHAASQA